MNWNLFFKRKRAETAQPVAPNLFEELRLGTQSQVLLDSPAYQRAVETMRVKLHEAWARTDLNDRDGQHQLRMALSILDGFESHLKDESETAKLAKRQIDDEQKSKAA